MGDALDEATRARLDRAVARLGATRAAWTRVGPAERIRLLEETTRGIDRVATRWVRLCLAAEGLEPDRPAAGEEWLAGPFFIQRTLRLLRRSLAQIEREGRPRIPGRVWTRADGQVVARVFPADAWDRLFFWDTTADVWLEPGVTVETLASTLAARHANGPGTDPGRVCLVLGAGNASGIGPLDTLQKLFVENDVVLLKMHVLHGGLEPLVREAFAPLIDGGFLDVVSAGADVGRYLTGHPGIDELHMTGSDRTFEAIVFGDGEAGQARRARGERLLAKPFTSELGNVTPVIVVPGRWSAADLAFQAEQVASMLTNHAGFNCTAARVIVTHAGWPQREAFLDGIRRQLASVPTRPAWYPGAIATFDRIAAVHPAGSWIGQRTDTRLPWGFVAGLDPAAADEGCFRAEGFCGLFGETAIEARSPAEFLDLATAFANERLWGTLSANLIVAPESEHEPQVRAALDRALARLRYGVIAVNTWASVAFGNAVVPWGGFPGQPATDIQSGTGWVHNALMFERPQKSVLRAPFRPRIKPPYFASHRTFHRLAEQFSRFEARPAGRRVPAMAWQALRG